MDPTLIMQSLKEYFVEIANSDESQDQVFDKLTACFRSINYLPQPYAMNFGGFFRARTGRYGSLEKACEDYARVKDLSYPPDIFAKENRCNVKGNSVFYCSTDSGVSIMEVRPADGDFLVLSGYKPIVGQDFKVTLPLIGAKKILESCLRFGDDQEMVRMLNGDQVFKLKNPMIIELDKLLSEWFTEPVNDNKHIYKLSTAYFNVVLKYYKFQNKIIQGLIYPSVESDFSGQNCVFRKEAADNYLSLVMATIYEVKKKSIKNYELYPLLQLANIDGEQKLRWKTASDYGKIFYLNPAAPKKVISWPKL